MVNIALIGCGTVGRGVLKILQGRLSSFEEKVGGKLNLRWICDRRKLKLNLGGLGRPRVTAHWEKVVNDPTVDIVVELIGGYEPARTVVLSALKNRKHVATANKAILAKYWGEIFTAARLHHSLVYFEAAVGGGIPVIQGLNEGLAANRIEKIYGILNGTTNYILSRMTQDGIDYGSALKEAQRVGFAEADPAFDVKGIDAAQKLAILASLASGTWIRQDSVYREGVTNVDVRDIHFARQRLGRAVKLLAIAELDRHRYSARVHPALIPAEHPFANVNQEYNAIFVHGHAAGDVMFYGKGAGQMAAASAVVSDVIFLARQVANGTAGRLPYVMYDAKARLMPLPMFRVICQHYLRFITEDKPGVLSQIAGLLGRHKVSIASVYQDDVLASPQGPRRGAPRRKGVPIIIVTHKAPEGAVQKALKDIRRRSVVKEKPVHLRMEDLI